MLSKWSDQGRARNLRALLATGIVLGGAIGLTGCGSSAGPPSPTAAATLPGAAECGRYLPPKPQSITVACREGNVVAVRLQWSKWSATTATGTGVVNANLCLPNCAKGTVQGYPATFALSTVKPVGGKQAFTVLTATYTGARPFDGTGAYGTRTFQQVLLGG